MMAGRYHRAQILLDPKQHQALAQIAREQRRTISDVAREIVHLGLEFLQRQKRHRREALERLNRLRKKIHRAHSTYAGDPVAEARAERERQAGTLLKAIP